MENTRRRAEDGVIWGRVELAASYLYRFCSLLGRYHKPEPGPAGAGEGPEPAETTFQLAWCLCLPPAAEWDWAACFHSRMLPARGEAEEEACFPFFFLKVSISVSLSEFWWAAEERRGRFNLFVQMKFGCLKQTTSRESVKQQETNSNEKQKKICVEQQRANVESSSALCASHCMFLCFNNQTCHECNRRKRLDYVQCLHLFHWRRFRLQLIVVFITHTLNLCL